jgi:Ca2+/Na+ antiporter
VVVAAIGQKRSALALGNIIGSSISNILGAFALGLLFHSGKATFDRSSKIYTAILVGVTTLFVVFLAVPNAVKFAGPILLAIFVIYVLSIGYGIYKGAISAPEDSDSDSDSDSDDDDDIEADSDSDDDESTTKPNRSFRKHSFDKKPTSHHSPRHSEDEESGSSTVTLLNEHNQSSSRSNSRPAPRPKLLNKRPKSLTYHIIRLIFGFLALTISCYVLSHAISAVGDSLGLSNSVVGVTILSLATTLPEKFLAVVSGARGQTAIFVANTAGSNIFLLTLCAGILFCAGDHQQITDAMNRSVFAHFSELAIGWASAAGLLAAVLMGCDRRLGVVLLTLYIFFLVAEFTVFE